MKSYNTFMIEKLVIVGNGFDLAHGLKTSYDDFRKAYTDNEYMKKFKQLSSIVLTTNNNSQKWYDFESNIEAISRTVFQKTFKDLENDEFIKSIDKEMEICNSLFEEIKNLLKSYLMNVAEGKKVLKKEVLKEEFKSENTFVISFNYTDIVKQYSDKVDFIHGSLSDDPDIILGFANDVPPMDLVSGVYTKYMKEVQKFELKYLRYLAEIKDTVNIKKRLKEFQPHLWQLFSGKGGWAFPLAKNSEGVLEYDLSSASRSLQQFYQNNKILSLNSFEKYKNVKELVIMGHGLESDELFFSRLRDSIDSLSKIILYTYEGESEKEVNRKKSELRKWFGMREIKLKKY